MNNVKLFSEIINKAMLCLVLFQVTHSFGQEQEKTITPTTIPELQSAIEKVLEETQNPAIGITLVHGDSVVWTTGLGKANIEKDVDANEHTMFRIGSTSKMYVALAILKLQEEGRVSLKDKVRDLIPQIKFENPWSDSSPILIEHLLEHTTGWDDLHLTEYALNVPGLSLKEGLDYHPHSRKSRWVPGTRMSYCNSGPSVAAYIVEKITGQNFEDYVQENFFNPMGMENMTYFETDDYKQYGATLYTDGVPEDYWNIIMRPSGSINASPKDMAKMVQFFINRGTIDSVQLISESSLKRMETSTTTIGARAGAGLGYGLHNYPSTFRNFEYRSHNGAVNGGLHDLSYLPGYRIGYSFAINSGNWDAYSRITGLIRGFQTQNLEVEKAKINSLRKTKEVDLSGYYVNISPRQQLSYFLEKIFNVTQISQKEDTIFSKGALGGDIDKHLMINATQFISPETGKISMVIAKDPLDGMVIQKDFGQVLKKVSPVHFFGQLILVGTWLLGMVGSILFSIPWTIRYWMGKISGGANIGIRLWPLLSSLLFTALVFVIIIGIADPFTLGRMNFLSISITILTTSFALVSAWSVYYLIKNRKATMNRIIYWYSVILACLHLIATCYLLLHGIVGIRLWT